jgi:hypothetical protein
LKIAAGKLLAGAKVHIFKSVAGPDTIGGETTQPILSRAFQLIIK